VEAELKDTMGEISAQQISMEGYVKQVLDSLGGMQAKIDELQMSLGETTTAVTVSQQRAEDISARMIALEQNPPTAVKFVAAPPLGVGNSMGADSTPFACPLPSPSGAAAARPSASASSSGSGDHRDPSFYRGDAPGILGNQRSAPVTGTNPSQLEKPLIPIQIHENRYEHEPMTGTGGRLVRVGEDPPQKWIFPNLKGKIRRCGSRTAKPILNSTMFRIVCGHAMLR
jgi:hypothetical protein